MNLIINNETYVWFEIFFCHTITFNNYEDCEEGDEVCSPWHSITNSDRLSNVDNYIRRTNMYIDFEEASSHDWINMTEFG